ncbi:MAG: hypothetical protein JW904_08325 [Spirochaetales bacterium]|nr:hypothetical protein [Spirochaetales bacterium]
MIRWNAVAIAGAGAFVLSFILGLLSGSVFGIVLLRAVIFGGVFAGIAAGGLFLIDKFIPELLQTGNETPYRGRERVDITLPEENPMNSDTVEEISTATESIDTEDNEIENAVYTDGANIMDEAPPHMHEPSRYNAIHDDEYSEEENEELEGAGESGDSYDLSDEDEDNSAFRQQDTESVSPRGFSEDAGENADDIDLEDEVAQESKFASPMEEKPEGNGYYSDSGIGTKEEDPETDGQLDVLPDMGNFESSFTPFPGAKGNDGGVTFDSFSPKTFDNKHMDQDPATFAKAVRTIIKREEKG